MENGKKLTNYDDINSLNPDSFVALGDWHGNTEFGVVTIQSIAKKPTAFVHTGDFGFLFSPHYLNAITDALEATDSVLYFVDGNHENFQTLYAHKEVQPGLRKLTERIYHLGRGFQWEWSGAKFVAFGGARSIDRARRIENLDWWPEEEWSQDDMLTIGMVEPDQVDYMITHDAPAKEFDDRLPLDNSIAQCFGTEAVAYCNENRRVLSVVVNKIRPKTLVHGHYHVRYTQELQHFASRSTTVIGLDCDQEYITDLAIARNSVKFNLR